MLLLANNSFAGTIPTDVIQQLSNLMNLDLSFNRFSGPIDPLLDALQSATALCSCDVSNNALNGSFDIDDLTSHTCVVS